LASFLDPAAVYRAKEDPLHVKSAFAYAMEVSPVMDNAKFNEESLKILDDADSTIPRRFFAAVHLYRNAVCNKRFLLFLF